MSFEEERMSEDKYPSIYLRHVEIEFIIFQIFFTARAVLNIGEYPRPIVREQKYLMDYKQYM